MKTYDRLVKLSQKRANYFCLIDPDSIDVKDAARIATTFEENGVDGILVGGSMMLKDNFEIVLKIIKESVKIPVLIFPGIFNFVSPYADALLLLSMVSSRNAQMLIGEQVRAAPLIKQYNLESIGTGYMLIDGGRNTSVQYMSFSQPIPRDKNDIAIAHALAAQYLGMKLIYMDAGSGANFPISNEMITAIKRNIDIPLIVGGGIKTPEVARQKAEAGADFIIIGSALEKTQDVTLIKEFVDGIHGVKRND